MQCYMHSNCKPPAKGLHNAPKEVFEKWLVSCDYRPMMTLGESQAAAAAHKKVFDQLLATWREGQASVSRGAAGSTVAPA